RMGPFSGLDWSPHDSRRRTPDRHDRPHGRWRRPRVHAARPCALPVPTRPSAPAGAWNLPREIERGLPQRIVDRGELTPLGYLEHRLVAVVFAAAQGGVLV